MGEEMKERLADSDLLKESSPCRQFQAEREEVLKHNWTESEKAASDLGSDQAMTDWLLKHRSQWRQGQRAARREV
jgi:hypothetical protein